MSAISLYKDIIYNFETMEKTIADGRAHDIDFGFIEIFIQDIQEIDGKGFDKAKIRMLTERLSLAADRISEAASFLNSTVDVNQIRPIVGKLEPLDTLAKSRGAGHTKQGLELLSGHFEVKRIAQDGHCLFRAIAAGTLDYIEKLSLAGKERYIATLQKTVEGFKDKKLTDLFNKIQVVRNLPEKEKTLNTKETSDLLVEFLRNLASAYNRTSQNEVLTNFSEDYLISMSDMQKLQHGGEPELVALQSTLGLDLRVVDAIAIGKGELSPTCNKDHAQDNTVFLLYTPLHYDIAYSK